MKILYKMHDHNRTNIIVNQNTIVIHNNHYLTVDNIIYSYSYQGDIDTDYNNIKKIINNDIYDLGLSDSILLHDIEKSTIHGHIFSLGYSQSNNGYATTDEYYEIVINGKHYKYEECDKEIFIQDLKKVQHYFSIIN